MKKVKDYIDINKILPNKDLKKFIEETEITTDSLCFYCEHMSIDSIKPNSPMNSASFSICMSCNNRQRACDNMYYCPGFTIKDPTEFKKSRMKGSLDKI